MTRALQKKIVCEEDIRELWRQPRVSEHATLLRIVLHTVCRDRHIIDTKDHMKPWSVPLVVPGPLRITIIYDSYFGNIFEAEPNFVLKEKSSKVTTDGGT